MEALIELLKSPEGALVLEMLGLMGIVVLFSAFVWVFRDARDGRRGLHEKIDSRTGEIHERIDGLNKEFHDHTVEDARRWGQIEGYLNGKRT